MPFAVRRPTLAVGLVLAASGCPAEPTIELRAVRGCGLDQTFSGLRVRVIGDFPAASGDELLLGPGESAAIPELREDATGLLAEGLFGGSVTAIGRSLGIEPGAEGALSVYFAAPDRLCPVPEAAGVPGPRAGAAMAIDGDGRVIVAGGREQDGQAPASVVVVDLREHRAELAAAPIANGRVGHTVVALADDQVALLGGVVDGEVQSSWRRLVVDGPHHGAPQVFEHDGPAYMASARSPVDGATLLAGGCSAVGAAGVCSTGSATASTAWFDGASDSLDPLDPLPDLTEPRWGGHAAIARDGVAYLAGGFDSSGASSTTLERLSPGGTWTILHDFAGDDAVIGLAVLPGELVVAARSSGAIDWWSPGGSGVLDPTLRAPSLTASDNPRPMLTLPGERVVIDDWLFAPGSAAIDPSGERRSLEGGPRRGAAMVLAEDGTVVFAGGTDGAGDPVDGWLQRLRPALDGPDEWIPDLAGPQTDAFVTSTPGAARVVVGGLHLDGLDDEPPGDGLPVVRAHVRGFRSFAARLEFAHAVEGEARAWAIVEQGSRAALAIDLGIDADADSGDPEVWLRRATGEVEALTCETSAIQAGEPLALTVGEGGSRIRLTAGETVRVDCTLDGSIWPDADGVALGFGVTGSGTARLFSLRLARQ